MSELPIRAVGVPWYSRDDYPLVLQVMTDSHLLPTTFEAWLAAAEKVEQKLVGQGFLTVKAHLDPRTFPDWCKARGLNVDAAARQQYASLVAYETHGKTH